MRSEILISMTLEFAIIFFPRHVETGRKIFRGFSAHRVLEKLAAFEQRSVLYGQDKRHLLERNWIPDGEGDELSLFRKKKKESSD